MSEQLTFAFPLKRAYTLERFVGDLGARALALSTEPVWISGPQESGKSHLLQGLCQRSEQQEGRAFYLSLSNQDLGPDVLSNLAEFDLVALDGLDYVLGDRDWELALFDLVNAISHAGEGWLVLASTCPLPDLSFCLADLASRSRAMHWLQTGQLNDAEKAQVLLRLAEETGFHLPDEVLAFLLDRAPREIGALIRVLNRLAEESLKAQRRMTIPFLKRVLGI